MLKGWNLTYELKLVPFKKSLNPEFSRSQSSPYLLMVPWRHDSSRALLQNISDEICGGLH